MDIAEIEATCSQLQANDKIPRKRIVIETKKTTTTTTTTRKEFYVNNSDISMSEIEVLLNQTDTDAIPTNIENVIDVNERSKADEQNTDDATPLFSSTKLIELHESPADIKPTDIFDAIKCENDTDKEAVEKVSHKTDGKSLRKGAKTKSVLSKKVDSPIEQKSSKKPNTKSTKTSRAKSSTVPSVEHQPEKRYPSRRKRTPPTTNMAKIATAKEPKQKSRIDELVNTYASMVRAHHTKIVEKPKKNEAPPPQATPLPSHELSAIIENPDESMESRAYSDDGQRRSIELERSYPDVLIDIVEHALDTYNVDVPDDNDDLIVSGGRGKSSRRKSKAQSVDNVSKSTKSGRVTKTNRPSIGKNDKMKKAVAELAADTIEQLNPLKAIVEKKGRRGASKTDAKHTNDDGESDNKVKHDPKSGKSDKKPKAKGIKNDIPPTMATNEIVPMSEPVESNDSPVNAIAQVANEEIKKRKSLPKNGKDDKRNKKSQKAPLQANKTENIDTLAMNDFPASMDTIDPFDAIAQKENVAINKRKSDPKQAKDVKASKKSQPISKSSTDSHRYTTAKKTRKSIEKLTTPPQMKKNSSLHALDNKSIKIYSPSYRHRFKSVNGNHVKITKEAIEKAIAKNCKSSKDLLKHFHAHDVEIDDDSRLLILPGQKVEPISKEEEATMDPLALGRKRYCAHTLIVREME